MLPFETATQQEETVIYGWVTWSGPSDTATVSYRQLPSRPESRSGQSPGSSLCGVLPTVNV